MKDRWGRVILYLLLIPLFFIIPTWLSQAINPGMRLDRYERLVDAIQQDLILSNASIIDGTLQTGETKKATFDYFELVLGEYQPVQDKIQLVFLPNDLAVYIANIEISRSTYRELGLIEYDFMNNSQENVRLLASSIRILYNETTLFKTTEMFLSYFGGLFDFIFYSLLMALFMMVFTRQLPIPFSFRLKLSVYLSTIFVVVELTSILFSSVFISYLSIPVLYIWHFWAYKSIKIVDQGLTI
jgi:hypothetical protein